MKKALSIVAVLLLLVSFSSCEKELDLTEDEQLELFAKDTGKDGTDSPGNEEEDLEE